MSTPDPHAGQPVLTDGPDPSEARLTLILVHGRGGSAAGMLDLGRELGFDDIALLAPQAAQNTWYPLSFLAPIAQNEPNLSSALGVLGGLVRTLERSNVAPSRIGWVGFSQGACLTLEFVARNAQPYAGVAGLSGGVIGPPGTPRQYDGTLDGTPTFLGCSDVDSHIPLERVHETTAIYRALGAVVDERIYAGMGHLVNENEIERVRALFAKRASRPDQATGR
jgi:predicted esterase